LPVWFGKTLFQCSYTPDQDSYLLSWGWSTYSHTQFSYVPASHDDLPHLLSSLSCSSSTLPSPENTKSSHCSPCHHSGLTPSTAYTEYSIHWVLHTPRTASSQDRLSPAPSQSFGRPCCTQFSTFPQLWVNQSIASQHRSRLPPELPPRDWLPPGTPPITLDHGLQFHLQPRSITASKCISTPAQFQPPSSYDHGLQVHLQTRSIMASKFISKLRLLWTPSSHDHRLQVHPQTHSITASMYIIKEWRRVNWVSGVKEVDRVTGSTYSADPGVYRHHLISISCYHTMRMHTLCFPTFGLTRSVRDFVDPGNCVDPQRQLVSYLLTQVLPSSNQKLSVSWISSGCREKCSGVLMVGSLPSSSIVSPQQPPKWCISKLSQ